MHAEILQDKQGEIKPGGPGRGRGRGVVGAAEGHSVRLKASARAPPTACNFHPGLSCLRGEVRRLNGSLFYHTVLLLP